MFRNQKEFERWARIVHEAESSSGSNSDALPDGVVRAFEKLLERKGGDASAVAMMLFNENKSYRDTIGELRGKVPAEGSTVLSADEAKEWAAYKALGAPADIQQGLEQRTQLQGQLDEAKRTETLRSVAETAGYKPTVLATLDRMAKAQGKALAFEVRDVTKDGKTVPTAFVKDGDAEHALSDYAAAQWADFLPALTVQGTEQPRGGTPFPAQHAGTGGNQKPPDLVGSFVQKQQEQAKAAPNPLLKK